MELESATGKLNAYFDGRQPEIMGMIERLVNMDSFSEDGEDVNKVGETVSGWMREAGFHTEKIAKPAIDPDESWMEKLGNVFSARTHEREAGPGIVFLGHMDTVFPAGTAAARPFRVEGGRAYGPGVGGMGSSLKYSFRFGCIRSDRIIILRPSAWLRGTPAASYLFAF